MVPERESWCNNFNVTFLDGQRLMYISYIRHPKAPATSVDHPSHHEIPESHMMPSNREAKALQVLTVLRKL